MLGGRQTIFSIIKVSISNIFKLLAGVLVGFLLPKLIGVDDYGYYKIFTLYAGYVGLFHFGIADGIYLQFGGKDFEELNKGDFRYYSRCLISIEIIISALICVISCIIFEGDYKFIFICVSIYLVAMNITNYYQLISQVTKRFNELSFRNIIGSSLTILSLLILFIINRYTSFKPNYRMYVILVIISTVILGCWYLYTYRGITFGKASPLNIKCIIQFIIIGFPLMLSSLCVSLILTIDRQFVSILFDISVYAVYAFAYNMLSLVTTAISAISTVLYPVLKRADEKSFINNYERLVEGIQVLVFGSLVLYYPLCAIVKTFLPQYVDSLPIFRIIFPGIAISSTVTIVMHNYYKTLGWNTKFFIKSIITLLFAIAANYIAYCSFKTTSSISIASIITMILWYVFVQYDLVKAISVNYVRNSIYIVFMMVAFYGITMIPNIAVGIMTYLGGFFIITMLFYKNDVLRTMKRIIHNSH